MTSYAFWIRFASPRSLSVEIEWGSRLKRIKARSPRPEQADFEDAEDDEDGDGYCEEVDGISPMLIRWSDGSCVLPWSRISSYVGS
jgi:hypothetical protein